MIKVTVSATEAEPVDVHDLAFDHLRIDSTSEDAYLEGLIRVARAQCEARTKRLLRPGSVTLTLDGFKDIELPRPPLRLSSALAIYYIDSTGGTSTVSSTVYELHDDGAGPVVLTTAYGQSWPTPRSVKGSVTITYYAGYSTSNPCPDELKQWIMLTAGSLYENREAHIIGQSGSLEMPFLDGLLDPYIVHSVS